MATFTRDWDESTVADTAQASTLGAVDRANQVDLSDRLKDLIYGFVAGENDGVPGCKNLAFKVQTSDPTVSASTITLFAKDVSSEAHLYFKDESADVRQITKAAGLLNIIAGDYAADSIDEDDIRLANNAYLTARNQADDGDINLIKVNASDVPEILVGAVLSASTAPGSDAAVANKKYVDDQITAKHAAYSGGESHAFGSGLIIKMGEKACASAGNYTVTYGTAFPTGVVSITFGQFYNSNTNPYAWNIKSVSGANGKTGFTFRQNAALSGAKVYWTAIGY